MRCLIIKSVFTLGLVIFASLIYTTILAADTKVFPKHGKDLWDIRYSSPSEALEQANYRLSKSAEGSLEYHEYLLIKAIAELETDQEIKAGGNLLSAYFYFSKEKNLKGKAYSLMALTRLSRRSNNDLSMRRWLDEAASDSLAFDEELQFRFYSEKCSYLLRNRKWDMLRYYIEKMQGNEDALQRTLDTESLIGAYHNMSIYFIGVEPDSATAFELMKKGRALRAKHKPNPYTRILIESAEIFYHTKKQHYDTALEKLIALDTVGLPGHIKRLLYRDYMDVFVAQKDFENAFFSLYTHVNLDPLTSLRNEKINLSVIEAEEKYRFEQQQKHLEFMSTQANLYRYLLGLGLLFLISLLLYIISVRRIRQKDILAKEQAYQLSLKEAQVAKARGKLALKESLLANQTLKVKHEQSKAQLAEQMALQENMSLREQKLTDERKFLENKLSTVSMSLVQRNEILDQVGKQLEDAINRKGSEQKKSIQNLLSLIRQQTNLEEDWEHFRIHFEQVHDGFFDKLLQSHSTLTNHDFRLCAFLRMRLSSKEIALMLGISNSSVDMARYRLRKKLELGKGVNLTEYISQF